MSEQLVETTFCGFTAREVLAMESRIDDFKKQLAIAVDALEEIKESVSEHWSQVYADETLTRIKQLQEKS